MANLDVNYLNELRHTFYSADHQKEVPSKGKKKQKHKSESKHSNTEGSGKVKNPIDKVLKPKKAELVNGENLCKGTKIQLSLCDTEHEIYLNRAEPQDEAPLKGKKIQKHNSKTTIRIPKVLNSNTETREKINNTNIDDELLKPKKAKHIRSTKKLSLSEDYLNGPDPQNEVPSKGEQDTQRSEKIKNRIHTPFKPKNASLNDEKPGRGTKRRLSASEAEQEVTLKKKKEKPTISKGIQLNFLEDDIDATNSTSEEFLSKKGEKPKSKRVELSISNVKKSTKDVILKRINKFTRDFETEADKVMESFSQAKLKKAENPVVSLKNKPIKARPTSLVKIKKVKEKKSSQIQQNCLQTNGIRSINTKNAETAHDFYDNNKLNVRGMNLEKFCNLFTYSCDDDFIGPNEFNVPKKFYKTSKKDNYELNIESGDENKTVNSVLMENHQPVQQNIESDEGTISANDIEIPNEENQILTDSEIIEIHPSANLPTKVLKLTNNDQILIIPDSKQLIHIYGLCTIQILNGEVEILGATLTKNSPEKKVYSPRGTSLLYIKNNHKLFCDNTIKIKSLIASNLLNDSDMDLRFEQHCAIILCRELKEPYMDFIESHMPQILFPEVTSGPRVDFGVSGNWNKMSEYSEGWENVLNCTNDSKTVICGGKGVGKSTFLRYSVNLLLGEFPKVRIVDLDSGQSEFFPPGFIGIVTVEDNILGPNFTHIQPADTLILSHINIGHDIQQYTKSVKHLIKILDKMPPMPTLINFPGYTQGFGMDLTVNLLKILQPQIVIEIKSKSHYKNYKIDLRSDNINNYKSILLGNEEPSLITSYEYFKFDSLCDKNEAWALEARPSREICVLAYFGKMMSEGTKSLTCHNLNMFSINISALGIVNFAGKVINPLAVNGCLVALCSIEQDDVFVSYGLGFVRGLDLENDNLVLLTPEKDLERVSHLVLTSVSTPPSLLMSASGVRGNIPFVNKGELVDFGQLTKRSYLPAATPKRG